MADRGHKIQIVRERMVRLNRMSTPRGYREETRFPIHQRGISDINLRTGKIVDQTGFTDWENTWGNATWPNP